MENNPENQKNPLEIHSLAIAGVLDSKNDSTSGPSPKKVIQLGVVQSSIGNRSSTISLNKKSRWDQAPDSGEEIDLKQPNIELPDGEQNASVKNLIQKFENFTEISSLPGIIQSDELPIKPVGSQTNNRVKLVRTNFMKIDKPTSVSSKTNTDNNTSSEPQQKDGINKQSTSISEAPHETEVKPVTSSTALSIISSCYDSPSDDSSQEIDVSCTPENKTTESAYTSLEKMDALKGSTKIENSGEIHTEKVTSTIEMEFDNKPTESISKSKISCKDEHTDSKEDISTKDNKQISCTQLFPEENVSTKDNMDDELNFPDITDIESGLKPVSSESSVKTSTVVGNEITNDNLIKLIINPTLSSNVSDNETKTEESLLFDINKDNSFQTTDKDSVNEAIESKVGDLNQLPEIIEEEKGNSQNISDKEENICSSKLVEKVGVDGQHSENICEILPSVENITCKDQSETKGSEDNIKTSLVKECYLHGQIIEAKTSGVDDTIGNVLSDSSFANKVNPLTSPSESQGNDEDISASDNLSNISHSDPSEAQRNIIEQRTCSLTCEEDEIKEFRDEIPPDIEKTPILEEICIRKEMYITGDNSNISGENNRNENQNILSDTAEENITENISVYKDAVDATMERMFSDSLESSKVSLYCIEQSNKEDMTLCQTINMSQDSMPKEEIFSTNENKKVSVIESNKIESHETNASLLEILESENSQSNCSDSKKDILEERSDVSTKVSSTSKANEILSITLPDTCSDEIELSVSCVSKKEIISKTVVSYEKEVEMTSEPTKSTENVEQCLTIDNIETIDLEKGNNEITGLVKMAQGTIDTETSNQETIGLEQSNQDNSKKLLLNISDISGDEISGPERDSENLNDTTTKHTFTIQPISLDHSENVEECTVIETFEGAQELTDTEVIVEPLKVNPANENNISQKMSENKPSISHFDDNSELHRNVDSTETIVLEEINPGHKISKSTDTMSTGIDESKHNLLVTNSDQNLDSLEDIVEDKQSYEKSIDTSFSTTDNIIATNEFINENTIRSDKFSVVEYKTSKSDDVKQVETNYEVSVEVNETTRKQFSDTDMVSSEGYLPLNKNENFETSSHNKTESKITSDLLLIDEELESKRLLSLECAPEKEVMNPTEHVEERGSKIQVELSPNSSESVSFSTVNKTNVVNEPIKNKSISYSTSETHSDSTNLVCSIESTTDNDSEGKINIVKPDICYTTDVEGLKQKVESETLDTRRTDEEEYFASKYNKIDDPDLLLEKITSTSKNELLPFPEIESTITIKSLVSKPLDNEQNSLLSSVGAENLQIHEDNPTDESTIVASQESEVNNVQCKTTTVEVVVKEQSSEMEIPKSEKTGIELGTVSKVENKDCMEFSASLDNFTESMIYTSSLVSKEENIDNRNLESQQLSSVSKKIDDLDKSTYSYEEESEQRLTQEDKIKQGNISINEPDENLDHTIKNSNVDKLIVSEEKSNDIQLNIDKKEEISNIVSQTNADLSTEVVIENVDDKQSLNSPKEILSFDNNADVIMGECLPKDLTEGSQSSNQTSIENSTTNIDNHSKTGLNKEMFSPSPQPQAHTENDLSEHTSKHKFHDEEKDCPEDDKDTVMEVICDDVKVDTIQAIDSFLRDTNSENNVKLEAEICKDGKTSGTIESHSYHSGQETNKTEVTDNSLSLEKQINCEIYQSYSKTPQEHDTFQKEAVSKELHDNNERPKTCIGKEINLGTVSSFEKEYQERGDLVSDLDSVSDKENPLKKSCSEKHENEKFEELKDISSLNDEDLAREKSFETVTTSMISDTNISLQPQKLSQFSEIVLSQCPSQTPLKSSQEDNASSDLQNSSSDQIDSKVEVENQIKGQSMKKPEIVIDSCSSQQITITSPHKLLQPSKIFSSQCPSQISSKDSSQENVSSDVQISSLNQSDSKLEMKTETEEQNTKEPKVATDICSSKLEINNQIQELNIEKRDVITDICSSQPNTILFSSQNLPQSIDIVSSQYHSQTSLNNKMQGKDVSDDQISSSILNDSILELDNQIKEPNINTHEIITKVCPNLQEPISSSLLESKVNILPKEVNIESSDSCFSSLDSLKNIEDEVHIKSSDIVLKEDKIYSKDVSHVDIEAVNILKAEPVQETKFKQSEEVLGTLAKEVDNSSNIEVEKTTEVSSKHIMSPDNYQPNDTPKNKKSLIANSSETRRSSLSKDVEKISKSNAYPQLKSDVSPECSSTEAIDLNNTTEITDSQPDNSITKTLLSDKCIEVREKDERLTQDKSFLDDTEVKSNDEDKETCKTEMSFGEAEVIESAVTNSAIAKDGNIAEQNKISLGNLSSSTVDDKTSNKGMTSMSVEAVDTNDDDNNSSILKHSRKKQKKNPDVQTESEKSNEVSSPKSERQTVEPTTEDPVELSSHKILSESPQFSDSQTKLITKSIPVKEVPPPVRVSARQKQRQAAAAAALAAEEKSKTGKDSPECVSKKSITQDKDKRGKKSLSPTKELQIKVSSGKVELSKQSPILVQKSPKNLDGKQSSHISPKRMVKEIGQDKLEPITLKLSKEDNPVIVRSSSLSPKKILSPLSPQTKTLGYTLKIGKDSTTIVPKDSTVSPNTRDSSPSSSSTKADLSGKVGYLIKDTGLTITPIAPTETQEQKLSKITLKLSKAGGHPEIKQEKSETWKAIQKLGEIDIVPVEGKPHESSKRKDKSDQDSPEKKIKLGEITVEPSGSGMSKLQGLLTQAPLNQSDDSEDIQFVGFGPSPEKVQPTQPLTYDVGLVKQETETTVQKRRGRPRKILTSPEIGHAVGQSIPPGMSAKDILAVSLQHQTLQQHIQQIQPPISITPSEEQECSATMFPVPLFDLSEDTFMDPTPPTVFPEQVQPQTILRSARGRPIGRSRRPRGSGILRAAERGGPRGRPRGSRGIKRMLEEMEALSYPDVDEHITLDNIDSEIGPRMSEQSGSQITEKTIALLRKSIEGKKEGIDKRARKSDSGDEKNRDSDIDAQVREMKEKIEAAYQAELKFPGKEGKKKTCLEKIEGREKKGPPELIPLQKSNSPDKKVKANSPSNDEECIRKKSADEKYDSFHGVGKESLKRKFVDENPQKSSEGTKRKSIEDRINESKQSGSSQDQSENENFTTEGNNSRRESLKGSDNGDTMDIDQPISPEEPDQVVEVKSEPEPPPKPVKPRPKSKAEIKRIKREKDRIRREAKKLAALEALKLAPPPNPFEEDTRMSATDPNGEGTDEFGSGIKKNRMEVGDPEGKEFTVDQIAEYQWPLQGGELYMIQEQISTYLGVKSFKRKYPDLKRRPVEMEERTFLCDSGLVSESMCDLGLTAVSSSEVLDIMFQDFQEQYEELRKHMREKQARELINKQKERKKFELSLSKSDLKEQAIQSAVSWNSQLNRSRSESRRCHLDLQTWTIQYPRSRGSKMTRPTPKMGNYPVALIPGQYADFCKRYTAQELRYWPVNTVLYGPLQPNERHSTGGSDGSQSESEDSSSSDDSSDSSSEGEGTCEEEEKGCKACGGKRGSEALVQCSQCGHNSKSSKAARIALFPINTPHGSTATVWA